MNYKLAAVGRLLQIGLYVLAIAPVIAWAESPLNTLRSHYPLELWLFIWFGCLLMGTLTAGVIVTPLDKQIHKNGGSLVFTKFIMALFTGILGSLYICDQKGWPIPGLQMAIWAGVLSGVGPTTVLTGVELLPEFIRQRLGIMKGQTHE
jgi:hypothetical protein